MGPAEMKCLRESLGLSTAWLARRWDVAERSVQRWERDRQLPVALEEDLERLAVERDQQVAAIVRESGNAPILVPRLDREGDEWPAEWHRAVALIAQKRTGRRIEFLPDTPSREPSVWNTVGRRVR